MNSKTEKPAPPKLSPQETANLLESCQQLELATRHMAAERQQLRRVIWLMAMKAGGELTVQESLVDPLWTIQMERGPENALVIKAGTMDGPTEEQLAALVKALAGTNRPVFEAAREIAGLEVYPAAFLEFRIAGKLRNNGEKWVDAALLKEQITQKPPNN